jgi:hypothetical protein
MFKMRLNLITLKTTTTLTATEVTTIIMTLVEALCHKPEGC